MVNGARARELAGLAGAPLATGSQQVKDEIGVVASGAHGSRNRVDKPCFARGGATSQTPSYLWRCATRLRRNVRPC